MSDKKEHLTQAARTVRAAILQELKGNAPKVEDFSIRDIEEKKVKGRAFTKFRLDTDVNQISRPGQATDGQVVSDQAAADKAINAISKDKSPHLKETLRQKLISRSDKGFGLNDEKINIPINQPDIIIHKKCGSCQGQGGAACQTCRGQGQMPCPSCRGRRQQPCPICQGRGQVNSPEGSKPCAQCAGRGHMTCKKCRGSGMVACTTCRQTGKMPCRECDSTGAVSDIFKVQLTAATSFSVAENDTENVPEKLGKIMADKASALISSGILAVSPLTGNASSGQKIDREDLEIGYNFETQFGSMVCTLNGYDFECAYAPNKAKILSCPPFLEHLGAEGLSNLHEAAKAPPMQTEGLVREAAKYKFIRELIYVRSKNKLVRSMKMMAKAHRYGFNPDTIKEMVASLNKVFYDLSRAGRVKGLLGGLSASLILNMVYFLTPLRTILLGATPSAAKEITCDFVVFGLAVALNMVLIKVIGKTALNRTLSDIVGQKISMHAAHLPYGKTRSAGILGNIILFAGTYYLALMLGRISSSVVMRLIY